MRRVGLILLPLVWAHSAQAASLSTVAQASPRPAVCLPGRSASESELWSRARGDRDQRFCLLLSRGYARLERSPSDTLTLAREAGLTLPGEVEARVLQGRALVRLGEWEAAAKVLSASVTAPGRPLGDLAALRELGVAWVALGRTRDAARIYRVLVPRVDFVQDRVFARLSILEAAAALMANDASGVSEAALHLGVARQADPVPGFQDLTLALLALALDRQGKSEQAALALAELPGAWALEQFLSARELSRVSRAALPQTLPGVPVEDAPAETPELSFHEQRPLLVDGELHALIGLAASRSDPRLAAAHLTAFLQGPSATGPWASWAKTRLASLGRIRP